MLKTIAILSAGIKKIRDKWSSSDLDEKLPIAPGGKLRLSAAYYLYQKDNNLKFITMGQVGGEKIMQAVKHPNISTIMKDELKELGIPARNIIQENKSNNTFEQLLNLIRIKNDIDKLGIITNRYHLKRVGVMINHLPELKPLKRARLISAEDICILNEPEKWAAIIQKAYQGEKMIKITKSERRGIEDIKRGRYKLKK